jgi:hypothetical protein
MGDSTSAVEPPPPRVEPELPKRRHRRITGPAGLLLFVCMFLPAVKGCNSPVYPLEVPMFLPPYVYGLVFALGAATVSVRGMRRTLTALRIVTLLTILGSGVTALMAPPLGMAEMFAAAIVLAFAGWTKEERRAAACAIAVGVFCTLWFGLWCTTSDALIGVYLSLVGAVGLLVGGFVWLGETALVHPPPIVVPRAVARRRE